MQRIVLAASLIFTACGASAAEGPSNPSAASPGAGGGSEVGAGSGMECHEETKTGSSISHQVCRSKDQSEDDRRGARDFISQPHTVPTPGH